MISEKLRHYIDQLSFADLQLDEKRRNILGELTSYVHETTNPQLVFICTHNSRRSHLTQVWAQTAATYFGIEVRTFSGGTEVTAFHPNAVSALERAGFEIEKGEDENPIYRVHYSHQENPLECYSKKFDDEPNPKKNFAAIMTCSEADAACPVVFGASTRIRLTYEDPKVSDGTPVQDQTYDERCKQIARELFYAFSQV